MKRNFAFVFFLAFLSSCGDGVNSVSILEDEIPSAVENLEDSHSASSSYCSSSLEVESSSSEAQSSLKEETSSSETQSFLKVETSSSEAQCSLKEETSSSEEESSLKEGSSSSEEDSSLKEETSSSEEESSLEVETSSSEAPKYCSSSFVIPESSISTFKNISLSEIRENINESFYRNLLATDTFEISYSMETTTFSIVSTRFSNKIYFVGKGKNRYYIEQSNDLEYLKSTRTIVNGEKRKVVSISESKIIGIFPTSQEFSDSLRNSFALGMVLNPLDSSDWQEPVQVTDEIYVLKNAVGDAVYYNASKKSIELYEKSEMIDNRLVELSVSYIYDENGFIKKQSMTSRTYTEELGLSVGVTIVNNIDAVRSSSKFPDVLFKVE